MISLRSKIDEILAQPLEQAQRQRTGIGYVGADIPLDLLILSNEPVGHLPWDMPATLDFANQWLEPSFPGWARNILQHWHAGRFDVLRQVVFSRSDDASQRLYYYVRELQQRGLLAGPKPLIFDIALIERAASRDRTAFAIARLADALAIPARDLALGIERINVLRKSLSELAATRSGDGAFYERLNRACLYSGEALWLTQALATASAEQRVADPTPATLRVLLAGSAPPDERLHHMVESAGATVTGEAHVQHLARLGAPLDTHTADPIRALAEQLRAQAVSPRSFKDRGAWLVQQARTANAQAAIVWLTREDEALAWHVPAQRRALQAAGIPALFLTARHWLAQDGAADEITRFIVEQRS
jgi:2-hydroxyglutaryl-CoA dehydratase, D-component